MAARDSRFEVVVVTGASVSQGARVGNTATQASGSGVLAGLARRTMNRLVSPDPLLKSETAVDQGPRRRPFRPLRNQSQQGKPQRPAGIRPPGSPHQNAANARSNYERYTTLAKDAARRGEIIEAENFYQHAEHYFRTMREQE